MELSRGDRAIAALAGGVSELKELRTMINNTAPLLPQDFVERFNTVVRALELQLDEINKSTDYT